MRRSSKRSTRASARGKAPRSRFPCSMPWRSGWRCRSSNTRAARRPSASASPTSRLRPTARGADILISIQSDREWRVLAEKVLGDTALAADPAFATNVARIARRAETDARVAAVFGAMNEVALMQRLADNAIAFARVNDVADLASHPQLRRIQV